MCDTEVGMATTVRDLHMEVARALGMLSLTTAALGLVIGLNLVSAGFLQIALDAPPMWETPIGIMRLVGTAILMLMAAAQATWNVRAAIAHRCAARV